MPMRIPSANPYTFRPSAGQADPWSAARPELIRNQRVIEDRNRLPDFFRRAATTGVLGLGTAGLGSMLAGGGAAASAAPSGGGFWGGVSMPTFGGAVSSAAGGGAAIPPAVMSAVGRGGLGAILNSPALGLGVNALTSFFGNRSANRQAQAALQAQLQANAQATALQERSLAEQSRQFDLSQADARAALEAQNAMRRRELDAAEEERAFNRRLVEEREARLAPHRQNALRWAATLQQMLGAR